MKFLSYTFQARRQQVSHLPAINYKWPLGLDIESITLSVRVRNGIARMGLNKNPERLSQATIGELLDCQNLGTKSILELTCVVEAAIELFTGRLIALPATPQAVGFQKQDYPGINALIESDFADDLYAGDPRFTDLLPFDEGTLREHLDQLLSDPVGSRAVYFVPDLERNSHQIVERATRIVGLKLESLLGELLTFLLGKSEPERVEALASRMGWGGSEPITLEEAGGKIGITRERLRQIEVKVLRRARFASHFLPALDRAIEELELCAPLSIAAAGDLLRERGISDKPFSAGAIIEIARQFERNTSLHILESRAGLILASKSSISTVSTLFRRARSLAGGSGVASLDQLAGKLSSDAIQKTRIRKLLESYPEVEFLSEEWFWLRDIPQGRNRLVNVLRRMLSVASPQSVASLREGVRRDFSKRMTSHPRYSAITVPPTPILREFVSHHPDFRLVDEQVYPRLTLDYRKELGETEQTLVEVLRSSPTGLLDRQAFSDGCAERGMNENTFSVMTTYSSIVEHPEVGVWKLRGTNVSPEHIEALLEANRQKPREQRLVDFGWTANGNIQVTARLPRNLGSFVLGVPGPMKRFLVGRSFVARAWGSEIDCGQVSVNDEGASYGYGTFLSKLGFEEGDLLTVEFDLTANVSWIAVGADEEV